MDLVELSRLARVSRRTIRYYIAQGLLPSPGKRGRGATYDRSLLDRLALIGVLQRDGWPLGKIAERMAALDDDGIRRELGVATRARGSGSVPPASPIAEMRTTWERVPVGTHVEISYRSHMPAEQRQRAARLIRAARRIFAE